MTALLPANWYPDPEVRHDLRYWDGAGWTDHVASGGVQSLAPIATDSEQLPRSILDEPYVRFELKKKPLEIKVEYTIIDERGRRIGEVRELDRKLMNKVFQLESDRTREYRFEVIDDQGDVLLRLSRLAVGEASPLVVQRADGTLMGQVSYATRGFRRTQFDLEYGGLTIGSVTADKWWTPSAYEASDSVGSKIAWISVTPPLQPKSYDLRFHEKVPEPLRSLVFGAAVAVDLAVHRKRHNGIAMRHGGG